MITIFLLYCILFITKIKCLKEIINHNYFLKKDIKIPLVFDFLYITSFFDQLRKIILYCAIEI